MAEKIVNELISEISETCGIEAEKLKLDATLRDDINMTSPQKMMVIGIIEDMTGKTISYGKMNKFKTVGEIADFVVSHTN